MNSRFTIILIALVAVFAGIFVSTKHKNQPATSNSTGATQLSTHLYGDKTDATKITDTANDADVPSSNDGKPLFIEYGDYQCPACTAYYPIVKEAVDSYKDKIVFQFRNYPLTSLHPNAMAAHRAAEAAGLQGKYWEMHDLLYEQHDSWADSNTVGTIFEGYAKQLGLDVTKFKADVASSTVNDIIQADLKKGQKLGITGTPTFFLNGQKVSSPPQDAAGFKKLFDQAIAAQQNK